MLFVSVLKNTFGSTDLAFIFKSKLLSISDKSKISDYMRNRKFVTAASTKKVYDEFKKRYDDSYCCVYYSDGKYEWTSAEIMYFEKYSMVLNEDFIDHVLEQ